ncbi:DUF3304 domain-containing protein [Burkholderia pseudomallei]|uniref:Uncharacterized protein n=1 Tax=Burkholderia pseudomallei TaxID=28450 RepID=A0A2K9CRK6_BURPE|nr:DUF3304 domain-containing protein [Burkholderia pseudomallei]KGX76426.1 hypothetical protein Y033_2144 [Burkholderia pseudomallei MSHR435]AIS86635.1 hypothetical protein BBU_762 [Burkholderia pseudomallei NAU35A-3]AJX22168.1 hypothetical protein BG17_639 [Burkholderia pseudomallei MSHR491]AJX79121.1 hypothetical protein BG16_148 [Burkholderia pseudomallei MSHR2543]AUG21452.1 DUF3304 domain-containing protein [Burkholderia pseudomallei]
MNLHFGSTKIFVRLVVCLMVFLASTGCSRAIDHSSENAIAGNESVAQSGDDIMSLKLDALNYTDIPVGTFYVDGVWGGNVFSRIGSGGGGVTCCVSLPKKWHPGLSVTVEWRNDEMYKKNPESVASRTVPVEKYGEFTGGYLWVLFFPGERIKVYATPWLPGAADFPEGLQAPSEACPGDFTLLNSDSRCKNPDKRIKP